MLPGIERVACNNFLEVLLQEAVPAVVQDVFVGAEGALNIHACHGAELELGHLLHTPSCHHGVRDPRLYLGHLLQDLEAAVLPQDLLQLLLEDFALRGRDAVDLLLDLLQDGQGVREGMVRLLQTSDRLREEGEVALDEGQVDLDALLLHEVLGLPDALGLVLAEHVHHALDLVQVVDVEESCLEPRASASQDFLSHFY